MLKLCPLCAEENCLCRPPLAAPHADDKNTRRAWYSDVPITSLAWHPDGRTLALGLANGTLAFWNGAVETQWPQAHRSPVLALAWSPGGALLASASAFHTLKLWNWLERPAPPMRTHSNFGDRITALAWSPDGKWLAAASRQYPAKLWDYGLSRSGTVHVFGDDVAWQAHDGVITTLLFDHSDLWSAGLDGAVRCWRVPDADCRAIRHHQSAVRALCLLESSLLVVGCDDGTVRSSRNARLIVRLNAPVRTLTPLTAGRVLITAGDGTLAVWDVIGHGEWRRFTVAENILCAHGSADGHVAIGTVQGSLFLWKDAN